MRPRVEGFAVLVVLALLAVVGLYTAATLQDTLFGIVLAGTRVQQQRAFVLADAGVASGMQELVATLAPADHTFELSPDPGSPDLATVELRETGAAPLAAGFSAGLFMLHDYEIRSTATAARGARSVQVQGVTRVLPAPAVP